MNALDKLFTPSGNKFFSLFEEADDNLRKLGQLFFETMNTDDKDARKGLLDRIEKLEQENDALTHRLFVELGKNFITPFDREDIHYMASSLDDIADFVWGTAKQMYYFDIVPIDDTTKEIANDLVKFTELLSDAIKGLRNRRELTALNSILTEMRGVASDGDNVISMAIFNLFNEEQPPINVIKLSDHYDMLQQLNNKCTDIINVLEGIIIKYG
ncbi:MAG: DUF47 family protein [Chitinophagales bacterium]|nr:DUF47 family protein [Chitinophagaceae bacterium]MCB9064537.1 DUF47 family protein [Chitinophagales bacterium]